MFVYLLRSIKARWLENLAIIAVFTVVVATATLIMSFAATMKQLAVGGGDASTVILLSRGSTALTDSAVGKDTYDWVRVRPELAQSEGVALVSPELITQTQLRTSKGVSLFVPARGIDPIAFKVHDKVRLIKGRLPQPGTDEVLLGKTLDGVFSGFSVGGQWNKHPIVGVFSAGGSLLEHELWLDRSQLLIELGRRATEPFAFLYVKAKSPADAATLVDQVTNSKQPLSAFTEPGFLKTAGSDANQLSRLALAFSLLLAVGAGIAAVNTLYSSLLGRQSELATLYAIGVRRRRLAALILQESVVLSLFGIALGIGITVALDGQQVSRLWTNHPFEQLPLHVGLGAVLTGAVIGLVVGVAGGLVPGMTTFRMDMRKALF